METEFEKELQRLRVEPQLETARRSRELRAWVDEHWRTHYVPEELLSAWGYNPETLSALDTTNTLRNRPRKDGTTAKGAARQWVKNTHQAAPRNHTLAAQGRHPQYTT
jgi:hypothetical protein